MCTIRRFWRQAAAAAALAVLLLAGVTLAGAQDSQYPQPNGPARSEIDAAAPPARAYGLMTLLFVIGGAAGISAIVALGRQSERAAGRPQ